MNSQHEQFLNLKTLPARVRVEEAALLLGFSVREMPILASNGLLKPLGRPPLTGVKYYAVAILEELRRDEKWLARASDCIVEYWQNSNQRRKRRGMIRVKPRRAIAIISNANPLLLRGVLRMQLNNFIFVILQRRQDNVRPLGIRLRPRSAVVS